MKRREVIAAIGGTGALTACVAAGLFRRDRHGSGSSSGTGWRQINNRADFAAVLNSSSQWNEDVAVFGFSPSPDEIARLADRGCLRFMFVNHVIRTPLSVLLEAVSPIVLLGFQNVTFVDEVVDSNLDMPEIRQLWIEECTAPAESVANLIWVSHRSLRRLIVISGPPPAAIFPGIVRCERLEHLELKNVGLANSDVNALQRLPRLSSFSYGEPQSSRHAPSISYVQQVLPTVFVDDNSD